jgi:hypothetical protein
MTQDTGDCSNVEDDAIGVLLSLLAVTTIEILHFIPNQRQTLLYLTIAIRPGFRYIFHCVTKMRCIYDKCCLRLSPGHLNTYEYVRTNYKYSTQYSYIGDSFCEQRVEHRMIRN